MLEWGPIVLAVTYYVFMMAFRNLVFGMIVILSADIWSCLVGWVFSSLVSAVIFGS